MATSNQNLAFNVRANSRQFRREMGQVKSIAKSSAAAIAGTFGVGLGFYGAVSATRSLINNLDDIEKASKRLGVSTDFMQKLSFASERSGTSMSTVEKGVRRMQRVITEAGDGLTTYTRTLDHLGLKYEDLAGKSPEDQFKIIAARLNTITDASQKSALAQQMFGRAGAELIPMLTDYASLAGEIESSGNIINENQIKAAEAFKDSMTNLSTAIQAMIGNSGLIQWLGDIVKSIEEINKAAKVQEKENIKTKQLQVGYTTTLGSAGQIIKTPRYETVTYTEAPTKKDISDFRVKNEKRRAEESKAAQLAVENAAKAALETEQKKTVLQSDLIASEQKKLELAQARLKLSDQEYEKQQVIAQFDDQIAKVREKMMSASEKGGFSVSDEDIQKVTNLIEAQKKATLAFMDFQQTQETNDKADIYK